MRAIGALLTAEESAALVAACLSKVRKPFRHGGRGPERFDCAGLILWGLQQIGRTVYDLPAYGREPFRDGLREAVIRNLGQAVPRASMRAGDVVLMAFGGEPRHIGLLAPYPHGGLMLIHTYSRVREVVAHRLDERWAGFVVEVFRP